MNEQISLAFPLKYFQASDCCFQKSQIGFSRTVRTLPFALLGLIHPACAMIGLLAKGIFDAKRNIEDLTDLQQVEKMKAHLHFSTHLAEAALLIGLSTGTFRFLLKQPNPALGYFLSSFAAYQLHGRLKSQLGAVEQKRRQLTEQVQSQSQQQLEAEKLKQEQLLKLDSHHQPLQLR